MPETEEAVTVAEEAETENKETTEAEAEAETEESKEPENPFKQKWENQRKVNRDLEKKLEDLRAELASQNKSEEEIAREKAQREAEAAALAKANERIARAELKAAAAGKVKRPDLLVKVTDLASIDVDENGDPDPESISDAIAAFLEEYPELAMDASKFSGTADQGTKGKQTAKRQLTREDIKSMSPEAIVKAQEEGLLSNVLGGKS